MASITARCYTTWLQTPPSLNSFQRRWHQVIHNTISDASCDPHISIPLYRESWRACHRRCRKSSLARPGFNFEYTGTTISPLREPYFRCGCISMALSRRRLKVARRMPYIQPIIAKLRQHRDCWGYQKRPLLRISRPYKVVVKHLIIFSGWSKVMLCAQQPSIINLIP